MEYISPLNSTLHSILFFFLHTVAFQTLETFQQLWDFVVNGVECWYPECRSQLTEWRGAAKYSENLAFKSPSFPQFALQQKIKTIVCRYTCAYSRSLEAIRQKLLAPWAFYWQEHRLTATLSPIKLRGNISRGRQTHPLFKTAQQDTFLTTDTQKPHRMLKRLL